MLPVKEDLRNCFFSPQCNELIFNFLASKSRATKQILAAGACVLHACMAQGEPSGQDSQQDVCGQARNALFELVPLKTKIDEDIDRLRI